MILYYDITIVIT